MVLLPLEVVAIVILIMLSTTGVRYLCVYMPSLASAVSVTVRASCIKRLTGIFNVHYDFLLSVCCAHKGETMSQASRLDWEWKCPTSSRAVLSTNYQCALIMEL